MVGIALGFLDDLAAAKEAPRKKSKPVEVLVNGNLYELVFYRADGDVWADSVARHPLRLDAVIDLKYGYNFNEVVLEIGSTTSRYIEGGEEHAFPIDEVKDGEKPPIRPKSSAWESFFKSLSGSEVGKVTDAIWALNEWDPAQEIERAKKALKAGSRRKSS